MVFQVSWGFLVVLFRKLEEKQAKLERQLEVERKKLEEEQRKLDDEREALEVERNRVAQEVLFQPNTSISYFSLINTILSFLIKRIQ